MRKYTLASSTAKDSVDLRNYQQVIEEAVHQVLPKAVVMVETNCYYVTPPPTPSAARAIGRLICKSPLKEYCVQIPKLFFSVPVELKEDGANGTTEKCIGGHY